MRHRFSALARMLGIALVALALSPLSAPFATLDISDFLGDAPPVGGAVVHAKKAPDHGPAHHDVFRRERPAPVMTGTTCARVVGVRRTTHSHPIPLRI